MGAHNAAMVPMRFSTIFKSRWMALIWAAGIVWLAVDVAAPDESADGNQVASDASGAELTNADVENLAEIVANM